MIVIMIIIIIMIITIIIIIIIIIIMNLLQQQCTGQLSRRHTIRILSCPLDMTSDDVDFPDDDDEMRSQMLGGHRVQARDHSRAIIAMKNCPSNTLCSIVQQQSLLSYAQSIHCRLQT